MPNTLREFQELNLHRNYPMTDASSTVDQFRNIPIPTELIADFQLSVPEHTKALGIFYISKLNVRSVTCDIEISYQKTLDSSQVIIGHFFNIATDRSMFTTYALSSQKQSLIDNEYFEDITGSVTIGYALGSIMIPGSYEYLPTDTQLLFSTIHEGLLQLRYIEVDSKRYTGNVVLAEGEGITLGIIEDSETNTTTITVNQDSDVSSDLILNSDADILKALLDMYGRPITTINGAKPNQQGNLNIVGDTCVTVSDISQGNLTISNPCAVPCCDPTDFSEDAYAALNTLNVRTSKIVSFLTKIENNLTSLKADVDRFESGVGFKGG